MQKVRIGAMGRRRACIFCILRSCFDGSYSSWMEFWREYWHPMCALFYRQYAYLCITLVSTLCIPCQPLRATRFLSITNANVIYQALYIGNSERFQIFPKVLFNRKEVLTLAESGFPRQGANPWVWAKNLLFGKIFAKRPDKNCIKMKEIGTVVGACVPSVPPPHLGSTND